MNHPKSKLNFMVPFPRNGGFVGKSLVASWFENKAEECAANYDHHCVALVGLGGIGYVKSTYPRVSAGYAFRGI